MDFVVVGFGLGALGVLLGAALRALGQRLRRGRADASLAWAERDRRARRGRWYRGAGAMLSVVGGCLWFATLVALLMPTDDAAGNLLVGAAVGLSALAIVAWTIAFFRYQPALPGHAAPATPDPAVDRGTAPVARARRRRRRSGAWSTPQPTAASVGGHLALLDSSQSSSNGTEREPAASAAPFAPIILPDFDRWPSEQAEEAPDDTETLVIAAVEPQPETVTDPKDRATIELDAERLNRSA